MNHTQRPAKTVKEVLQAVLWMYQNGLVWITGATWLTKNGFTANSRETTCKACLTGAIQLVDATLPLQINTVKHLQNVGGFESVIRWNDNICRKKEDVIHFLEEAIKTA